MSILTNSPSPINLNSEQVWAILHIDGRWRTVPIQRDELDAYLDRLAPGEYERISDEPEHERERDDDATLFEGQNYNWMREYGEDW